MGATDCASEFNAPVIIGVDELTTLWCMKGNPGNEFRPATAATAAAAELEIDGPFDDDDDFGSERGVKSSAPSQFPKHKKSKEKININRMEQKQQQQIYRIANKFVALFSSLACLSKPKITGKQKTIKSEKWCFAVCSSIQ